MKQNSNFLRFSFLLLGVVLMFSSCKKNDDPTPVYSAETEAAQIKQWITEMSAQDENVDTTSLGVYYIIDTPGTGATVQTGDTVTVKYTGYFLNGTVFDSSLYKGDGTMTYVHKNTDPKKRLIPGWEDGIELLSKGSKAVFLISSDKAYGTGGYGPIPPYTPLIFVIEVINIK